MKLRSLVLSTLLVLVGCGQVWAKPTVFVSIVPQKFFVQQLGGEFVDVEVMVKPGASPATYEPKSSQMAKLAGAAVYFAIGVPFERAWLARIGGVNPGLRIIHTDEAIEKMHMASHHHDEEHHAEGKGEHETEDGQGIVDPHIWLSPPLVKVQAAVISQGLRELLPAHSAELEARYQRFIEGVDQLDRELRNMLATSKGVRFMVFHPSWGYFAREYGLTQVAIEIEGKNPKPSQLQELILYARANDIRVIFAQPQFSKKNAEIIAREIRGEVSVADPLAEDWFGNLRGVTEKIRTAAK